VVNRGGYDEHLKITKEMGCMYVETEYMDLSSTEMRKVARKNSVLVTKGNSK
jgi:nicotinic acid mononucleotide adenylyltransferase